MATALGRLALPSTGSASISHHNFNTRSRYLSINASVRSTLGVTATRKVQRRQDPRKIRVQAIGQGPAASIPGQGLSPELESAIDTFVLENKVVLFMKGTREMPLCGFSNTVTQILNTMNVPYVTVNILEDDLLRNGMKEYSAWPTFPQVYVDGEFFGGCDIMIAAYQSGELAETLEAALNS